MRLLLVLLLIGFNNTSFAGDNIHVVYEKQYSPLFGNNDVPETNASSFSSKVTAQLTHSPYVKHNCQHRQIPFARFSGTLLFARNACTVIDKTIFVSHDCFCKPIQQLLLFPKHYFW